MRGGRLALALALAFTASCAAAQGYPVRRGGPPPVDYCKIKNPKWKHLEKRMPNDREFSALKRDYMAGRLSLRDWQIATNMACP
jgi:hypothetical protein